MQHTGRMMWMWFHTHINDTVFFKDWWIRDVGTMVWSCIVVALLAVVLEAIRWLRWVSDVHGTEEKTWYSRLLRCSHYKRVLLHVIQAAVGYTLMLAFMTFSVWLCISLCVGLAFGHYLFGNRRFKMVS